MKLLIINTYPCHYEIIESVILKYKQILQLNNTLDMNYDIYLHIYNNPSFKQYINEKHPKITFITRQELSKINFNNYINCTIYDKDYPNLNNSKQSNIKYISHEITDRLKTNPNVWFLTPLSKRNYIYADILPYTNQKKSSKTPIYVVQGNLNQGRRCLNLLNKILDSEYEYKFTIKVIGRGNLPKELEKHKSKIVLKANLNFIDFHKEFLDAYCILPLISKKTHTHYYTNKLTSSINYARGYNMKCLIDDELQKIYKLNNAVIYKDIDNIINCFRTTLEQFYKNTK